MSDLQKHKGEFARYFNNNQYETTEDGGVLFPKANAVARGGYYHTVNGSDPQFDPNLVPNEGLVYVLNAAFTGGTAIPNWFVSLYASNYTPVAALTAATYVASANEIVSITEGYTGTTRPAWTPVLDVSGAAPFVDNMASKASFTIATSSQLVVNGAAVLSEATKGAVTGTLVSATKFASARTLYDTDVFDVAYRIQLASV